MSDDIPSATNEPQPQLPKSKEDQKAAAALESLNTVTTDISGDQPGAVASSSSADREVLGKAMSRLEISGGQDGKKVTVKVAAEDVGLLVCSIIPMYASIWLSTDHTRWISWISIRSKRRSS